MLLRSIARTISELPEVVTSWFEECTCMSHVAFLNSYDGRLTKSRTDGETIRHKHEGGRIFMKVFFGRKSTL